LEVNLFRPVSPRLNVTLMEEEVLHFWQTRHIFQKSDRQRVDRQRVDRQRADRQRSAGPPFVFYEGPPTANGKPGIHHALARAFKDIFLRYKIMRGHHVLRRAGWDTHGLPVEIGVEKQLGFTGKSQIEAYGIAEFNDLCRKSAFEYIKEWENFTHRIGFWVDLQDAYVTFTNEYIESVWWILKQLWDRQLLYQGTQVVPYCPRCGTPLSDHEVALGYRQIEDPSIYVRMPLVDGPGTSLLVWTTTPWTLPGNVAIAVHPEVDYVTVERPVAEGGLEHLVVARPLLRKVFGDEDLKIVDSFKGRKLKGRRYHPLFTFLLPGKPAHFVVLEDYVTTQEGTGLVHIAPAFGAEDLRTARAYDLPVLATITDAGTFRPEVRPWSGKFVKDADALIIQDLAQRGLLFQAGSLTHTYPFCWRCETPLLYTARLTWFIRTSQFKDKLVALNQRIHWFPEHIQNGRFGNWLENNVDWALGRERYWGTPLPVWQCADCHHQLVIGSLQELAEHLGRQPANLDLHRPFVDELHFPCPQCGGEMQRVPEVIDAWFDSGAMPLAQWHYPFENQELFKQQFPADFICEAVDQTRGWFYALHAISTMLFESESFKNAISLGLILDSAGQKMSTSHGNAVDPWELLNTYGADALRWYLYTSGPPGQERRFSSDQVGQALRSLTLPLWNAYTFFVTYANLAGWEPGTSDSPLPPSKAGSISPSNRHELDSPLPPGGAGGFSPTDRNEPDSPTDRNEPDSPLPLRGRGAGGEGSLSPLDRWLLSELHLLIQQVTAALENYDVTGAARLLQTFVDNLTKWYLRRSRRRFWKNAVVEDRRRAYATLYTALVTLSKLLAPSMPFLAEALYQNLVHAANDGAPESVHLADWPDYDPALVESGLHADMQLVMNLASLGHAARQKAGIKVRQPLAEIAYSVPRQEEAQALEQYAGLLADELNVRQVRRLGSAGEAVTYSLKPLPKQLGQKYKSLFPKVSQALAAVDPEEAARHLLAGRPIHATVEGIRLEIQPDEVELRAEAHAGLAVATDGPYLAALSTHLTPELVQEGLAREFVHRVQELRKQAGFQITDRIRIYFQASSGLAQAVETHREVILQETVGIELVEADPPAKAAARGAIARAEFDGERVTLGLVLVA
jgi:isoleucyl-tRNA synthetase